MWASCSGGGSNLPVPYFGTASVAVQPLPNICCLLVAPGDPGRCSALQQPENSLVRCSRGGNLFFYFIFCSVEEDTMLKLPLLPPPISHQIINPPLPFFLPPLSLNTRAPPPSLSFFLSFQLPVKFPFSLLETFGTVLPVWNPRISFHFRRSFLPPRRAY